MNNWQLFYDEDCPLCVAYTKLFVKYNFLSASGRVPFSQLGAQTPLDLNRARNEIALYNTQTQTVFYGVDSLVELLNTKLPFVKPIAKFAPIYFLLRQLYKLISYNRKVIVGSSLCNEAACTPDFNVPYRLAFLALLLMACAYFLNQFLQLLTQGSLNSMPYITYIRLLSLVFISLFILRLKAIDWHTSLHYLGNVLTILFIGHFFLIVPVLLTHLSLSLSVAPLIVYAGLVSGFVIYLLIRRLKVMLPNDSLF